MIQSEITSDRKATFKIGEFTRASADNESFGKVLASTDEALNVVGAGVFLDASNSNLVGADKTGGFFGVLVNQGAATRATLENLGYTRNTSQVDVAIKGWVSIILQNTAAIGDWVWVSSTAGTFTATAPSATAPEGHVRVPNGVVKNRAVTAAGIAEIYFNTLV